MNVQIPMSKGACITFECLRAACIWLWSYGIWPSLIIRLPAFPPTRCGAMARKRESAEAALSRHSGAAMAEALGHFGFGFLSSFVIRVSSFELWFRHSFVIFTPR